MRTPCEYKCASVKTVSNENNSYNSIKEEKWRYSKNLGKYSVINFNFYIFKVYNIYQSTYYMLEISEMFCTLLRIKNYERFT